MTADRIAYGADPVAFGELRLPAKAAPHPAAVVIHGGCWRSRFGLEGVAPLAAALAGAGIATWSIEYRRIGDPGGGWPGTFEDVARGAGALAALAARGLDAERAILIGHSAGAHLALWLAGRRGGGSPAAPSATFRAVLALAPITDLAEFGRGSGWCNRSVARLLGGAPEEVPERYAATSPIDLLPLGVPTRILHGEEDDVVPVAQSREFAGRAASLADDVRLEVLPGVGHFDLVDPGAPSWERVEAAARELAAG